MKFRIVLRQFKFPMYATSQGMSPDWTDNAEFAYIYDADGGDNPDVKLKYWRGVATMHGYDAEKVEIEEFTTARNGS